MARRALQPRFRDRELRRGLGRHRAPALLGPAAADRHRDRRARGDRLRALLAGLWTDDWGTEGIWRSFGSAAVVAIAGSHACVVLGARRRSDSDLVKLLVASSLVLAVIDTIGGLLPIAGLIEEVGEGGAKFFGVTLVLLLLTTLLPPLIRRLEPSREAPAAPRQDAVGLLADEVATIAERIDELARGPALRTPEIRREAERLRNLARSFQP